MNGIKKRAFTLAELLIVLGIIGIVAALTMPALIASHKEKETVTRLKKAYSTLSNAYNLAIAENSTPDDWDLFGAGTTLGAERMMDKLTPYLKITKNCTRNQGCFPDVVYKYLNGNAAVNYNSSVNFSKMILSDGILLASYVLNTSCTANYGSSAELEQVCGEFYIDINGFKPPNTTGKDLFRFIATKNTIIPYGTQDESYFPFYAHCKTGTLSDGRGCTAWVLLNENMEYLKCNDLSWNGKTKCK